jgi:hypothetical protein
MKKCLGELLMLERLVITQTVGVKLTLIKSFRFKEWRAQGDDFRTFLDDFLAALPQIEFPAGLGL